MPDQICALRGAYYRAEADRVDELATTAEPGRGRERFAQVAAEYRTLAAYYDTLPPLESELEPAAFPTH